MNKYKIYCTTKQIKNAIDLGAPIEIDNGDNHNVPIMLYNRKGYVIPTAEEMIGWLETQGILIDIHFYCVSWDIGVRTKTGIIVTQKMAIDSRKEATIIAIDAALNYLIENNN